MSSVDLIAGEINENREFWLDKINFHLNNLLKKSKKRQQISKTHGYSLLHKESGLQSQNQVVEENTLGNPNQAKREG